MPSTLGLTGGVRFSDARPKSDIEWTIYRAAQMPSSAENDTVLEHRLEALAKELEKNAIDEEAEQKKAKAAELVYRAERDGQVAAEAAAAEARAKEWGDADLHAETARAKVHQEAQENADALMLEAQQLHGKAKRALHRPAKESRFAEAREKSTRFAPSVSVKISDAKRESLKKMYISPLFANADRENNMCTLDTEKSGTYHPERVETSNSSHSPAFRISDAEVPRPSFYKAALYEGEDKLPENMTLNELKSELLKRKVELPASMPRLKQCTQSHKTALADILRNALKARGELGDWKLSDVKPGTEEDGTDGFYVDEEGKKKMVRLMMPSTLGYLPLSTQRNSGRVPIKTAGREQDDRVYSPTAVETMKGRETLGIKKPYDLAKYDTGGKSSVFKTQPQVPFTTGKRFPDPKGV